MTGLTNFGAFVSLPDGKTGMVHISEVAPTYVKEIRDYLTENQEVKVKVLSVGDDGRVSLSIKRAMEPEQQRPPQRQQRPGGGHQRRSSPPVWQGSKPCLLYTSHTFFWPGCPAFLSQARRCRAGGR